MTDRVILHQMRFSGHHGLSAEERAWPQPMELDLEIVTDLRAAGEADDIELTVDYRPVFDICRQVVEESSYRLLEGIAETVAREVLALPRVSEVLIRVRKLRVPLQGQLAHAAVEIRRVAAPEGDALP